jgi:hypothetical protein
MAAAALARQMFPEILSLIVRLGVTTCASVTGKWSQV